MPFSTGYQGGAIKGRFVFLAVFLLLFLWAVVELALPTQSRPVVVVAAVVAPDQSIAADDPGVKTPGVELAVVDVDELAGSSEIDHDARVRGTEPASDGTAPTVKVSHDSSLVSSALVDTVAAERSLQLAESPTTTCTLIAAYNTDESVDKVCILTEKLTNTLQDGEADVSAINVQACPVTANRKNCRPRRRLNVHDPFDTKRSLQNIDTPSPTSTPTAGYIVFTAVGVKRTCDEIAATLNSTPGVISVSVDVGGTTELGNVSDNAILCHPDKNSPTFQSSSYSNY